VRIDEDGAGQIPNLPNCAREHPRRPVLMLHHDALARDHDAKRAREKRSSSPDSAVSCGRARKSRRTPGHAHPEREARNKAVRSKPGRKEKRGGKRRPNEHGFSYNSHNASRACPGKTTYSAMADCPLLRGLEVCDTGHRLSASNDFTISAHHRRALSCTPAARLPVPVRGIARVAFLTVQVGVDPSSVASSTSCATPCAPSQSPRASSHSARNSGGKPAGGSRSATVAPQLLQGHARVVRPSRSRVKRTICDVRGDGQPIVRP